MNVAFFAPLLFPSLSVIHTATGKTVAIQALSFVFTNLPAAVSSLPLPIRFLFAEAEERLPRDSSRQLRPTAGLLPWALLGCLCRGLEDAEALERLAAQPLERGAKERLALLSECLQASVGQPKGGAPKAAAHTALRSLEERRPKWIAGQLHKARKLCCKRSVTGHSQHISPHSNSDSFTVSFFHILVQKGIKITFLTVVDKGSTSI